MPRTIPIYRDFKVDEPPIGRVEIFDNRFEQDEILAGIALIPTYDLKDPETGKVKVLDFGAIPRTRVDTREDPS
jgi:hypothetical protein